MSAVSRHYGNKEDFIELFILTTESMSELILINFGGNVRMLRSLSSIKYMDFLSEFPLLRVN